MGKREIHFTPVGRQVQRVLEYPLRLENRSPMSYSRRSRYSPSLSPYDKRRGRSVSRSLSRSPTRSVSSDAENPGNSLYVTGLSHRVTERDLEDHFAKEGKVTDVHLVLDPWTRESRGFGFISMKSVGDANRCIRSLDHSVLQGRVITVEKFLWQQVCCL
ncbi:RNA-binding (RRM/RBD/RNP motifs) family protein [Arabidopsis thaliana]|uniref:Isoform 1b of Serine/arginine-rich splicing factor SR45a n=2 Tax=Arabidopsis thaliana TaxID=3702 RepID=Q84TH4-4|nr:RNA-binding (RRM/RBD/RNP motifs) family protein [Arabidopsis thaliana]ANM60738.1 RNA-binding (RRM/RBD/RNP motifs) family protein [Arabidopsis thaliana]|eukprot:NP_001323002.1 RNA-binding (RRM/RBD/RNP motifs) family protein [Arabidopsis thaliana]